MVISSALFMDLCRPRQRCTITREISNLTMELALEILAISIHKVGVWERGTFRILFRKFADDRRLWESPREDGMLGCKEKREDF